MKNEAGILFASKEQEFTAGVFLVDKPVGFSSFAMVRRVRKLLGIKKVGHAGTLDPFASGLLIICAGRPATRNIDQFMIGRKTYEATLQLGVETTTQDPEGEVTAICTVPELSKTDVDDCLQKFIGPQMQAPPAFSAAKYKGKPLYHYARKGIVITKPPKPIEIYSLVGSQHAQDCLKIHVTCSRGTYIRVLAEDIGRLLGCGAHLTALRRTASGAFHVEQGVSGEELSGENGLQKLTSTMLSVETAIEKSEQESHKLHPCALHSGE